MMSHVQDGYYDSVVYRRVVIQKQSRIIKIDVFIGKPWINSSCIIITWSSRDEHNQDKSNWSTLVHKVQLSCKSTA